jgi:hypothetical protein
MRYLVFVGQLALFAMLLGPSALSQDIPDSAKSQPASALNDTPAIPTKKASEAGKPDGVQPVETKKKAEDSEKPDPVAEGITKWKKQRDDIKEALKDEDPDFALMLGIGSLIVNKHTDYSNQSNILRSNNIGKATPQFLTGVSFRSKIHNFNNSRLHFHPVNYSCYANPKELPPGTCDEWRLHPWSGFVSVKFAPGSSQIVNGFVFGLNYAVTKYLNALIGYSLTPINEPSPGFIRTATQFVTQQQQQGQYLNFDPNAMLHDKADAFDGFPVTDSSGKLIFQGNPLAVHYHGGIVLGISVPIYFSSVFK